MSTIVVGSNSWCTLAYADSYMSDMYNRSAWADLSADNRSKLLISSYMLINQQSEFNISAMSTEEKLKRAQCELAWFLYNYGDTFNNNRAMINSGTKSFSDGSYSETFNSNFKFPEFIYDMLDDYKDSTGIVIIDIDREYEENS